MTPTDEENLINCQKFEIKRKENALIIIDKEEKEKYFLDDIKKLILNLIYNLMGIRSVDDLIEALKSNLKYVNLNASFYSKCFFLLNELFIYTNYLLLL